jgi:hypothetical protein
MKLRPRDVIGYQGQDFLVEGVLNYKLAGKNYPLARAVDGDEVRFIEPLMDDLDDRFLFFREVSDLRVGTPPAPTISYKGGSYVPRLSGTATVTVDGEVPERNPGSCEIWRYRAGGDVFLQIEKWPDRTVTLHGESVHKDMVTIFPAP